MGGKKGKGAGDPADGPDVDAGAKAIAEVMSLRTQLGMRQTALTDAETAKPQAEEKLAKLRADFDAEQETAYEISKDMTRQYKGMQEQLVERITQLSNTVQDLQDKLDDAESHLAKVTREKDDIIASKDEEISQMMRRWRTWRASSAACS